MSLYAARFTQTHPLEGPPTRMAIYLLQTATRKRLELLHAHDVSCEESPHGEVFLAAGVLYAVMRGDPLPGGVRLADFAEPLRRKLYLLAADLFDYARNPMLVPVS